MSENKGGIFWGVVLAAAAAAIAGAMALTRSFQSARAERDRGKGLAARGYEPELGRSRASESRTDGKNEVDK